MQIYRRAQRLGGLEYGPEFPIVGVFAQHMAIQDHGLETEFVPALDFPG